MKRNSLRILSLLLALLIAATLPLQALAVATPAQADSANREDSLTLGSDSHFTYTTDYHSGQGTAQTLPESAVRVGSGEGYTLYQVTEPEEMAAMLGLEKDSGSTAQYIEVQDEHVTAMVVVDGSLPLSQNETLHLRLGSQPDSVQVQQAQRGILAEQNAVYQRICKALDTQLPLVGQYSVLTNSFAIECMASQVAALENIPGVKSCYIAPTFEAIPADAFEYTDNVQFYGPGVMAGADAAWARGYTGEGMVIGIVDTGLTLKHNAFATIPQTQRFTRDTISKALETGLLHAQEQVDGLTADDLYYSGKVVYHFDYAESDTDVSHGSTSEHGTHVAGIAAGNDTTTVETDGILGIKGTAYNAQLAIFKVFSGENASFAVLLAGVEDAILLGLDAVNLSLGAAGGGTYDEGFTEVFDNALNLGVNILCAAGNEFDASFGNRYGFNEANTKNVDNGVGNIPANYASTLSVASVDSNGYPISSPWTQYGGGVGTFHERSEMEFYEAGAPFDKQLNTMLGGREWDTVVMEGYGTAENIARYDVRGKLVLLFEDRFEESVSTQEVYDNLLAAGAAGIMLVSEDEEEDDWPADMSVTRSEIPMAFTMRWCLMDYIRYFELHPEEPQTMYILPSVTPVSTAGRISDFSSRGTTIDLTIKPEISAVGGMVYSSYGSGKSGYAAASGTSMAAPQVAGAVALVKEYLQKNHSTLLADMSGAEISELINAILMSTANPIVYEDSALFWTVRSQGAGMLDLAQATAPEAYLTVNGQRPKLELGDDPERTGSYSLRFEVRNLTDTDKTYALRTIVQTEGVDIDMIDGYDDTYLAAGHGTSVFRYFMNGKPQALDATVSAPQYVVVRAGQTTSVSLQIDLTAEAKAWLDQYYSKGGYVEGFVFLTEEEPNGDSLSLPFLGFYGDWSEVSIMDNTFYWEAPTQSWSFLNDSAITINSAIIRDGETYRYLGDRYTWEMNPKAVGYLTYSNDRNYISPNGDGWRDALEAVYIGQMRYAGEIRYSITNAETGAVYYEKEMSGVSKNIADAEGMIYPTGADAYTLFDAWGGTDAEGNILPDGTGVMVDISFETSFAGERKTEQWSFPIFIDTQAPEVSIEIVGANSYEIEITDNGMLCEQTFSCTGKYGTAFSDGMYEPTQEEVLQNGGTSSWIEGFSYGMQRMELTVWDYAGNCASYIIIFNEGTVDIPEERVDLVVGEHITVRNVGAYDTQVVHDPLSWSSGNSSIATVTRDAEDENSAVIQAVAAGNTLVTATRKSKAMSDSVEVYVHDGLASILASAGENGSISDAGELLLPMGESKTYTITPEAHYVVADVLVDGQSVGAVTEYTFTNEAAGRSSHTIEARFALETFTVRFLDWDGSVLSTQQVAWGEAATAPEAPTRALHTFLCWDTDFSAITQPTDVKALYVENDMTTYYAIAIVRSEGGRIDGPTQVMAGEDATFTITPDEGYLLEDVLVDGQSVGAVTEYTFTNVSACHYIQAVFHSHHYTAEVTAPTCTADGYTTYTCTCGDSYVSDRVAALGHQPALQDAVEPGCTEDGYTGDTVCARCGALLERGETIPAFCPSAAFSDLDTAQWYHESVDYVLRNGLMQGVVDGRFAPNDRLTRAALVTVLYRLAGAPDVSGQTHPFADVAADQWYSAAITWAYQTGLVKGMDATHFQPDAPIIREQLATILYRYADAPLAGDADALAAYRDAAAISEYAREAMCWAVSTGLLQGSGNQALEPSATATRAQIATILMRFCQSA